MGGSVLGANVWGGASDRNPSRVQYPLCSLAILQVGTRLYWCRLAPDCTGAGCLSVNIVVGLLVATAGLFFCYFGQSWYTTYRFYTFCNAFFINRFCQYIELNWN